MSRKAAARNYSALFVCLFFTATGIAEPKYHYPRNSINYVGRPKLDDIRLSPLKRFETIYKDLSDFPMTRQQLADAFDGYMKELTGRSLTQVFQDSKQALSGEATHADRWIVLNAMLKDAKELLKAKPEDLARLNKAFPQWGAPKTFEGRTSPFQDASPLPKETKEQNRKRARETILKALKEAESKSTFLSQKAIYRMAREIWDEFDNGNKRNSEANAANEGVYNYGRVYVWQPMATRRDLGEVFKSLSPKWTSGNLDAPPTQKEREALDKALTDEYYRRMREITTSMAAYNEANNYPYADSTPSTGGPTAERFLREKGIQVKD